MPAPPRPTARPPYRPSEERTGPCVQNESALFVVLFRARAVSSSPLEMVRAELTLIISDPGERRALSLHTIKAAELTWRTCFSVNRGSQSTHTHKKVARSAPHHLSRWEAANTQGFDQAWA